MSSPKGQDGLNYWLCCNYAALRLVIRLPALPQPSWPFHPHGGEWGGSPLPATGALRKASKGGALPGLWGPSCAASNGREAAGTHSSGRRHSWVSPAYLLPDPFSEGSSRPLPGFLSCSPCLWGKEDVTYLQGWKVVAKWKTRG